MNDALVIAAKPETPDETIQRLLKENEGLRHKLDWAGVEYRKLQEIYTKLADQWNAFQATAKPIQRDVHRAEAAGELTRKLSEVLIGLAYDTAKFEELLEVLRDLAPRPRYEGRTLEPKRG